jgi:hypothetical protein
MGHVNAVFTPFVADEPASPIAHESGNPRDLDPEMGTTDGDVKLPTANIQIDNRCLLKPLMVLGGETNHRLTETDEVIHKKWLLFKSEGLNDHAEFTKRRAECKWERDETKEPSFTPGSH